MIDPDPPRRDGPHNPVPATTGRGGLSMPTMAMIGGLVLLVLILAYFAGNRDPGQDKLSDTQVNGTTATTAPVTGEKNCVSKATYDLIKRELFRRAAQRRGSDAAAYDRLSAYAVARMENPVMESEDANARSVECSGTLSLDLPPGVVVQGGQHTLMSEIDYGVRPAADGSGNVVVLRNADALVEPLATISRASQPAPQPTPLVPGQDGLPLPPGMAPPTAPAAPPVVAPPPAAPPREVNAHPSFDCGRARTRGEMAVCGDAGLASLDRQMAGQFTRALGQADGQQRFLLLRTRADFLQFRDSCHGDSCIADAYNGRIREIGDIMAGRWHPR